MQKLNDKLIFSCIPAPIDGANFADANFAQHQVWRDLNQNGVSDAGELFTLQSLGIPSLNTAITSTPNAALAGGIQAQTGSFTRTDGTTSTMADINLTQDTWHSRYIDQIAVPAALQHLPNISGMGRLRDLQQAAVPPPALARCTSAVHRRKKFDRASYPAFRSFQGGLM